jgi:hypothetical protein
VIDIPQDLNQLHDLCFVEHPRNSKRIDIREGDA